MTQSMLVESNMSHSYAEQNTVHYFAVKPAVACRLWLHLSLNILLSLLRTTAGEE